ncbi:MAG: DUF11 domain-containing protein [Rhodopirellula sp.]|nr:DUF11 domain-containing protein [Rhodopirellula sp.]
MNRSCQLLLGAAAFVVMSTTGCNLPISKLAPEFPSLDHFSKGSHGVACCANGDCTASRLSPMSQPLPGQPLSGQNQPGRGQYPAASTYAAPYQYPAGIQPASEQESRSIFSLFTADRVANQKRGLFSCGEHSSQKIQIRSQNQAAEPGQFPVEDSSGVAHVSSAPTNQTAFPQAPRPYGTPAIAYPNGPVQQASAVSFSYAEPRLAISEVGQAIYDGDDSPIFGKPHEQYPDEYLLDGGDRDHPVHYQGQYRDGLETEDTIGEYIDHTGKPHVKVTNQVAIYAPRFADVRAVTTPSGETAINRLAGIHEATRDSGVSSRIGPQRYTDLQRLGGVRVRSRASGVNAREGQLAAKNVASLNTHEQLLNTFEELSYFLRGEMLQSNEARLAAGIEAATTWTRDENPVVIATLDSLHEVTAKFRLAEMVGVEDPRKDPGRLEIVKVANRSTAKPGDIVTFAIRYENKGEREVTDVRIVDNLTPRLEYIEDSATSDRDGDIVVQDNEEGSLVLTFKLDAPLKEKTSGVVTFQCRVR